MTVDGVAGRYSHPDVVLIDVESFEREVLEGSAAPITVPDTTFLVGSTSTMRSLVDSSRS